MCIPKIFRWPTPWLWGAILVLFFVGADHFAERVSWVCMIIIAASIVHYVRKRRGRFDVEKVAAPDGDLDGRLAEIERRLTDTQEVMIALSEKMDKWDEEKAQP